jgi:hypothetical protein
LRGAGADLVRITPRAPAGGRIADLDLDIRNGVGDLVSVVGTPAFPLTVDISGVTLSGAGTYMEAGVVYIDGQGSVMRTRVTDVVTSEQAAATPGGWRGAQPGYAIAQVTRGTVRPRNAMPRSLTIDSVRVDRYNRAGIYVEGVAGEIDHRLSVNASEVVGRVLCQNFSENGNCSAPGLVTTGDLFGQVGVFAGGGARLDVRNSMVTQNLVNGEGAPVRNSATNNANLWIGAGIRLQGADPANSLITRNNIVDNAYGVENWEANSSSPASVPVPAPDNWWGLRFQPATPNTGPAISPTSNPPVPENPVNGDPFDTGSGITSTAVNFLPFRSGPQSDPLTGQFPNVQAPLPANDAAPAVSLSAPATAERGETITLTATPSDDFGVQSVRFFQGATSLGTVDVPPYSTTYTIPADAACGARSFMALVQDSAGQTAAATASVTVVEANNCQPPEEPPPPPPAAPTGALPPSLRVIKQAGTPVTATASAEAGVTKVEFLLGERLLCTVTAAPYTCLVTPRLQDVGIQTLTVVITDKAGQATTLTRQVLVRPFKPQGVDITVTKAKGKKKGTQRRTIVARVLPPAGVSEADACPDGVVTFVVDRRKRAFINSQQQLQADCTATLRFSAKKAKKKRYDVEARFPGNTVLERAKASRRFS